MKNYITPIFLIFLLSPLPGFAEKYYKFGVVPQYDARRIHSIWRPILDHLEKETGLKFILAGSGNIPTFEKEFAVGTFDFVYMNPYHILMANKRQKYLPVVRDISKELYGIVVVRKDSSIKNVKDLDGKVVAFPAPNALGASLLPRSAFKNRYKIKIRPKYVNTHTSVYLNVATGLTDAGGGVQKTFRQQSTAIQNKLKILYKTPGVASHPVSVHPRVPASVKQKVKLAFLKMGESESGRELLKMIPIEKIGPASLDDYRPIGKLGLESLYKE